METSSALEKLSLLEDRISLTTRRFTELKEQYGALQQHKGTLERELEDLRKANRDLSEKIHHIKSNDAENDNSFNREDVRKRLDRVLEKFGEFQL